MIARVALLGALALGCRREPPPTASTASTTSAALPATSARTAPPARAESDVRVEGGDWTAGVVEKKTPAPPVALLRALRSARHDGLDRVVFEFAGGALPGYHLEYVDRPVRRCGSGDVAEIAGDGWLQVSFSPAAAHDDAGNALLAARETRPELPIVRELELTCDFEAEVRVVIGVASPNRFRVSELASPARLVIDVRHR